MSVFILFYFPTEERIELELNRILKIGRSSDNDIMISDPKISREHGLFELRKDGRIYYKDLFSRSGSYLNGSAIQETVFTPTDTLTIGDVVIKISDKKLSKLERELLGKSTFKKNPKKDLTLPIIPRKKK